MYGTIKKLSKERKIPIVRLEDICGLSRGAICKWDKNVPKVTSVAKVADVLGVTVDDLLKAES